MTLDQIIAVADSAYPDGLVLMHHQGDDVGDGLAKFVAVEIGDTYDEEATAEAQLKEAHRAMTTARNELDAVCSALAKAIHEIQKGYLAD